MGIVGKGEYIFVNLNISKIILDIMGLTKCILEFKE